MEKYVHGQPVLVEMLEGAVCKRVCVVALSSNSLLLACLGKLGSVLCATAGPLLQYILDRILKKRVEEEKSVVKVSLKTIRLVRAESRLGVEVLTVEARSGTYKFMAIGRYARFGMSKLLRELKTRLKQVNPDARIEEK